MFKVICLDDNDVYVLATRRDFADHDEAIRYCEGIAASRYGLVVDASQVDKLLNG